MTVHSTVFRRPMTSVTVPTAAAPIITPIRPTLAIVDAVFGVNPQVGSLSNAGRTTPSTTRSNPSKATAAQHSGATQPAYRSRGSIAALVDIVVSPMGRSRRCVSGARTRGPERETRFFTQ